MSENELISDFRNWVDQFLAKPQDFLGGNAVCPFAQEAVKGGKLNLKIATQPILPFIEKQIDLFIREKNESVIFLKPDQISPQDLADFVERMREKYFIYDVWVLYDDPRDVEVQGPLEFNFKKSILVILQSLTKLTLASQDLKKRGYYKKWTEDYYKTVVEKREQYFERYQKFKSMRYQLQQQSTEITI